MKKALLAAFCILARAVLAQEGPDDTYGPQPTGGPEAAKQYAANLAKYKDNPDVLVLPGLVADRKEHTVKVLVESTGLAGGETTEFLIVGQKSSHGYESMFWSLAKPSDVHRGLEFIGLTPGAPANPSALRFWADGDRVKVTVSEEGAGEVPVEECIRDNETEDTLPAEGFVFTGSVMLPAEGGGKPRYAADVYDPRAVIPIYNDPTAVMDLPRQVSQGEAYGNQVVNPDAVFKGGTLLTVVMRPGDNSDRRAARHLRLSIDRAEGSTNLVCRLTEKDGAALAEAEALGPVLEKVAAMKGKGAPPFLVLSCGSDLPIAEVGKASALVCLMETMGMIRAAPPPRGQLFCRAFLPDKQWRKPEGRPSYPWELHLARKDGKLAGEMVWYEPLRLDDKMTPTFKRHAYPAPDPAAVKTRLDTDAQEREKAGKSPLPAVLIVFADAGLTYGDVLSFLKPALSTHGTVYVFVEQGSGNAGDAEAE